MPSYRRAEEVAGIVDDLIAHPEKIQAMKKNMAEIAKPRASRDIADLLVDLGSRHEGK